MLPRRPEPLLFVLLGTIWGSAYLAIKVGGAAVGPFEFVALRLLIGALFLAAVVRLVGEPLPPRDRWPHVAVVGLTGLVVPFLLITGAQRGIDAGLASIFNAATPLFTVALAAVVLADEPLRAGRLLGILVGFAGILVVAGGGVAGGGSPEAVAAMVLAVGSYAVTAVWTRRYLKGTRPLGVAAGQAWAGLLVTAPLAVLVEGASFAVPPFETVVALAWLGVLASGVAPLLFFRLVGAWGAGRTSLVNYLIPIVGVASGALVLGERIEAGTLVGALVVLAGVTIANDAFALRLALRFRTGPATAPARA